MASRLYRTTFPLFRAVEQALTRLGIPAVGTPTWAALVALAVTGLLLLDARPTQTRVSRVLPARAHDAHNRLLRLMPFSTRALMGGLMAFVRHLGTGGYVMVDDVIVEKAYARRLPWAGWTYSHAKQRKLYGLHIIVLLWCSHDGHWRIPIGFRLWRPKRSCRPGAYRTKLQLVEPLVEAAVAAHLPMEYIVVDAAYTAGKLTKKLTRLGLTWHGVLHPHTLVLWKGMRLVVTRNRHGNEEFLASNDGACDLTTMVRRKWSRWAVETLFRDAKQYLGLEQCQCWVDQAMVRHVALVLLSFVVLQVLRRRAAEPLAAVKERWQLMVLQNGETAPPPLRACPPELRPTA